MIAGAITAAAAALLGPHFWPRTSEPPEYVAQALIRLTPAPHQIQEQPARDAHAGDLLFAQAVSESLAVIPTAQRQTIHERAELRSKCALLPDGDVKRVRVTMPNEQNALRLANEIASHLIAALPPLQLPPPEPLPVPDPPASAQLLELQRERLAFLPAKDLKILSFQRKTLSDQLRDLRGRRTDGAEDLAAAEAALERASHAPATRDADAWESVRRDRLAAVKSSDELYLAAVKERTASAKEYWGELGAGKTEEHRDVVLAHRRLQTAEAAVQKRETELARIIDKATSADRKAAHQRQLQDLQERVSEVRKRQASLDREVEQASDELSEKESELAAAQEQQEQLDRANATIGGLQTEMAAGFAKAVIADALRPPPTLPGARIERSAEVISRSVQRESESPFWGWFAAAGFLVGGMTVGMTSRFSRHSPVVYAEPQPEMPRSRLPWPVLATIPDLGDDVNRATHALPHALVDAVRMIRTNLLASRAPRVLYVASPIAGAGTSSVISGLAAAYATAGRRVLMLDANLYQRDSAGRLMNGPASAGLGDFVSGHCDIDACIHPSPSGMSLVDVMPRGNVVGNPSDLLAWAGLPHFIQTLADKYDQILVDCPPFLDHPDVFHLAADGAPSLICTLDARTSDDALTAEIQGALDQFRGTPLGVVLNRVPVDYGRKLERGNGHLKGHVIDGAK